MGLQYFGTDGIRGRVGDAPMTVDFALRLASAAAKVLAPNGGSVLIGTENLERVEQSIGMTHQ